MWCACLFPAVAAMAEDVVIKAGDLRITYVENGKQFNVEYNGGKAYRPVFMRSVPEATYDIHGMTVSVSVRLRAQRPTTKSGR